MPSSHHLYRTERWNKDAIFPHCLKGANVTNQITSRPFSTLRAVRYSAKCFDCSVIEKAKLLTWSVQAVCAGKNLWKPWHKNCTVLFDHYDTAPTVSLLLLQYSQVHTDSQNTGASRKEPVCTQEKCHFIGIKLRYVQCTVMKMEPDVLWMHILLPLFGTDSIKNWTFYSVWQVPLAGSLF